MNAGLEFAVFFFVMGVFCTLFIGVHIMHFRYFKPKEVLKAALQDCFIAAGMGLLIAFLLLGNRVFHYPFAIFLSVVSFVLLTVIYAILGPTMIDRSASVFLLFALRDADGMALSEQEVISKITVESIMRKRFDEHRETGAVTVEGGRMKLTKRGKRIADFFDRMRRVLSL